MSNVNKKFGSRALRWDCTFGKNFMIIRPVVFEISGGVVYQHNQIKPFLIVENRHDFMCDRQVSFSVGQNDRQGFQISIVYHIQKTDTYCE